MDQINFKATATVQTDEGVFEAVISTEAVDREKDIVAPGAMVAALKKWNRPIPLSWNHSTKAEDIFGSIEPMTVREQGGEVIVQGKVDLESKVGGEAWRSFKSRTVGFSFGYLILEATERKGGGRHITALDVFEVTSTPTPMNNDTRVLATKGAVEEAVAEAVGEAVEEAVEEQTDDLAAQVKALAAKVEQLEQLERSGVKDADDKDPVTGTASAHDPLKDKTDRLLADMASADVPSGPMRGEPEQKAQPAYDLDELHQKTRDFYLESLSGLELDR